MPTFWDLPKNVRDIIYRHHLVYDEPVTYETHIKALALDGSWRHPDRLMPPIFHLSKEAEREAIPFYYEMNVFDIGHLSISAFTSISWPRHWNRVRRIECTWSDYGSGWGHYGAARESFISLGKMKGLEELNIRVDEKNMILRMPVKREKRQRSYRVESLTSQQNLAILRFPGVSGLLTLSKVKHVNFIKRIDDKGVETGGMIPGGALETHILPRLKPKPKVKVQHQKKGSSFRFLDLPAELRNHVYHLLLLIEGPIHPSKEPPTSAPKDPESPKITESLDTESALALLSVCKQMNKEAVGVYYHCNSFVFHYPVQLSAFLMAVGPDRKKVIRDITLYYHNIKLGGVELIDLTLPLLQQLPGLKRFHILMKAGVGETGLRRGWIQQPWTSQWRSPVPPMLIHGTNPALIPGMRSLFQLRSLTDLKVRDLELEELYEKLKKDKAFPVFPEHGTNANVVRLSKAFEHFNVALADAQLGKVNEKLFEIKQWQMMEEFPTMESDGMEKAVVSED